MTVNEFFGTIAKVATWLLPVVGVIALIYLALVLKNLVDTLKILNKTMDDVDLQVRKLDAPLKTVEELCHTMDDVHAATKEAVGIAVQAIDENKGVVKEWVIDKKNGVNNFVQDNIISKLPEKDNKEDEDNG